MGKSTVTRLAFTADGDSLITANSDEIIIWNLTTGRRTPHVRRRPANFTRFPEFPNGRGTRARPAPALRRLR